MPDFINPKIRKPNSTQEKNHLHFTLTLTEKNVTYIIKLKNIVWSTYGPGPG